MNKTKILAFIALAAILSACGSDDGGVPPKLAKEYAKNISPFDTLAVKFNSNLVDLDTSAESKNVVLNNVKWVKRKTSGKELYFIGANTTPGGLNYFEKEGSIEFLNIKNSDGYTKDKTVFDFVTLDLLDKEPNDSKSYANEIDSEKAKRDSVYFAGVLDHKIGVTESGQSLVDMDDYYMIKLKAADTVYITVTNREALSLIARGPSGTTDTTFQAAKGKSNAFKYIVGLKYLLEDPSLSSSDLVPFYINVTETGNTHASPPNPYTMRIKIMEYKK